MKGCVLCGHSNLILVIVHPSLHGTEILAILTTRGSAGWTQFGVGSVVYSCTCFDNFSHKLLPLQYAVEVVAFDLQINRSFGGELDSLHT